MLCESKRSKIFPWEVSARCSVVSKEFNKIHSKMQILNLIFQVCGDSQLELRREKLNNY